MKLYHASRHRFDVLKRNQAKMVDGVVVPDGELQNKIYFTPSLGFALAMAAGPNGITSLADGKISFELAGQFEPDSVVYVYEVDSDTITPELLEQIDEDQVTADVDELTPSGVQEFKARDVFDYYDLVPWKHPNERAKE